VQFAARIPLCVEEEWFKIFYEGKQPFRSTYIVVTLESDITFWKFFGFLFTRT
jgi:hypothetical protein